MRSTPTLVRSTVFITTRHQGTRRLLQSWRGIVQSRCSSSAWANRAAITVGDGDHGEGGPVRFTFAGGTDALIGEGDRLQFEGQAEWPCPRSASIHPSDSPF